MSNYFINFLKDLISRFLVILIIDRQKQVKMKKSAQRRRKHCMLAVVRWIQSFFTPPQTPSREGRGRDGQNLISWRWSLLLSTDPVW